MATKQTISIYMKSGGNIQITLPFSEDDLILPFADFEKRIYNFWQGRSDYNDNPIYIIYSEVDKYVFHFGNISFYKLEQI